MSLFTFLVPLWTKFQNHSRKKEKAFVRRRTFRLQNGARRGFFAPVHTPFQFETPCISNRKFPVRVRADSGSLAVTFPPSPGRRHSRFTRCDDTSRRAQPGGHAAIPSLPAPFFYESEALKKIFFTRVTQKGRLPARVVRHASPKDGTAPDNAGQHGATAFHPFHAKELTRPPEGAP